MHDIAKALLAGDVNEATKVAHARYPFAAVSREKRKYSQSQMFEIFMRDGFIDRYSGIRLYNPGFLRLLNVLMPSAFPFDSHVHMDRCHSIYWDLMPSIDHLVPISKGGTNSNENLVTTSMRRNMAKGLWSLGDLGWSLHPAGSTHEWDGCTKSFITLVEKYQEQSAESPYVMGWYKLCRQIS